MTRDEVAKALMELSNDDAVAIATSLTKGFMMRAAADHQLAPVIASMLDLQGIVIVTADAVGPHLESTSHEEAPAICQMLIRSLHKTVSDVIDTVCGPAKAEGGRGG